jgi:hypothetical protein
VRALVAILLLAACQPALAAGKTETVTMIGGPLGVTEPAPIFTATRDHITVFGLPANWSAGVSACHTVTLGQYKTVKFTFSDGNATVASLTKSGYSLINAMDGLPGTSLTVCRDGNGAVVSASAQISALSTTGSGFQIYVVNTTDTSNLQGYSYSSLGVLLDGEGETFTANSSAVNTLTIKN